MGSWGWGGGVGGRWGWNTAILLWLQRFAIWILFFPKVILWEFVFNTSAKTVNDPEYVLLTAGLSCRRRWQSQRCRSYYNFLILRRLKNRCNGSLLPCPNLVQWPSRQNFWALRAHVSHWCYDPPLSSVWACGNCSGSSVIQPYRLKLYDLRKMIIRARFCTAEAVAWDSSQAVWSYTSTVSRAISWNQGMQLNIPVWKAQLV